MYNDIQVLKQVDNVVSNNGRFLLTTMYYKIKTITHIVLGIYVLISSHKKVMI